jgi:hypothetical protein
VGCYALPLQGGGKLAILLSTNWDNFTFWGNSVHLKNYKYIQAVLKFTKLITEAQQREAVTQGRSLPPIPATV